MNMTPKGYLFWNDDVYKTRVIASSLAEATSKYTEEFRDYSVHDLYHVVNISEEGDKILGSYWDPNTAEDAADEQSECYPNALIEVMYKGKVV
jgi:hypothetical protein